jgi:hypothetical protein
VDSSFFIHSLQIVERFSSLYCSPLHVDPFHCPLLNPITKHYFRTKKNGWFPTITLFRATASKQASTPPNTRRQEQTSAVFYVSEAKEDPTFLSPNYSLPSVGTATAFNNLRLKSASESDLTTETSLSSAQEMRMAPTLTMGEKSRKKSVEMTSSVLAADGGDTEALLQERKASTLPRNLKPMDKSDSSEGARRGSGGRLRPLAAVKNLGQEAETGLRNGLRAVSSAGKRVADSLRPHRGGGADSVPRSWLMSTETAVAGDDRFLRVGNNNGGRLDSPSPRAWTLPTAGRTLPTAGRTLPTAIGLTLPTAVGSTLSTTLCLETQEKLRSPNFR